MCPSAHGDLRMPVEFTTTGGTSLRYDFTAGQFIQNWKTPKKPGACYQVTMFSDRWAASISANSAEVARRIKVQYGGRS